MSPSVQQSRRALKSRRILKCEFHDITERGVIGWAKKTIENNQRGYISTVNVAILMMMRSDPRLKSVVKNAALTVADGQPIIWLSKLLGKPLPERVTGVELCHSFSALAAKQGKSVYLLGATDEVLVKTERQLLKNNPGLIIAGRQNGYFSRDDATMRAKAVKDSGANILFIAMGVPRQDYFLQSQWDNLGVNVAIGVGGSFDVISGHVKRAPLWMQNTGLEWLFRLSQDPRRLAKRYAMTNTQYIWLAMGELLGARQTSR